METPMAVLHWDPMGIAMGSHAKGHTNYHGVLSMGMGSRGRPWVTWEMP